MAYFEHTHYYFTPKEMDSRSGKGPGTHDHPGAACGNGSFHFKGTRYKPDVTCPSCREKLSIKPIAALEFVK